MSEDGLFISHRDAATIPLLFIKRASHTPDDTAYIYFQDGSWQKISWKEMELYATRFQKSLLEEVKSPGYHIGIQLKNSPEWVACDIASLALGHIVVPLHVGDIDSPENTAYVIEHSNIQILFVETIDAWKNIKEALSPKAEKRLMRVIVREQFLGSGVVEPVMTLHEWLKDSLSTPRLYTRAYKPNVCATIVYTSGTTGKPKGVVLTHRNILYNAECAIRAVPPNSTDTLLSFLPLSHMLERTVGYYVPMMVGARVAFNRSIEDLPKDMQEIRPSIMITVPRIYERAYEKIQEEIAKKPPVAQYILRCALALRWKYFTKRMTKQRFAPLLFILQGLTSPVTKKIRRAFGGRIRFTISGGAPLRPDVGKFFISAGIRILQGYGLTEASPVVATNTLNNDDPGSIGPPVPGIDVGIDPNTHELLTRGQHVMAGYYKEDEATRATIDRYGWLHTGDLAKRGKHGRIYITGRIKDIIVLSTGEKVSPVDIEQEILKSNVIEQVLVFGNDRPFLGALIVPTQEFMDIPKEVIYTTVKQALAGFPHYARIPYSIILRNEKWTVENGLMTPTQKLKRKKILEKYRDSIEELYKKH